MNSKTIEDLLYIYDEPMSYYYFKDRYVIDKILALETKEINVSRLKRSPYAVWLNKPVLSEIVKRNNGQLCQNHLESMLPENTCYFNITFDKWGEEARKYKKDKWNQTSRSGYSLVLQLNFSLSHNRQFFELLKPNDNGKGAFSYGGHPIAKKRFITMGWSRMDIDFETGELLIEELQNDWLRDLDWFHKWLHILTESKRQQRLLSRGLHCDVAQLDQYYRSMKQYKDVWSEALLHASVQFVQKELGICKIWMHTFESGNMFKELDKWSLPPKSLYTQLPRKYGFEKTNDAPVFLRQEPGLKGYLRKASRQKVQWHRLPTQ